MLQILLYKCVRGLFDPRWGLGCPKTSVITNLRFVTSKNSDYISSLCFRMCYIIPSHKKYAFTVQGFRENAGLATRFLKIMIAEDLLCSSIFWELWLQFILFWPRVL
jgi:hypothetical protein